MALGLFDEPLCFLLSFYARKLARLHALHFFFDGTEVRFGVAAQFLFLGTPASFSFDMFALFV